MIAQLDKIYLKVAKHRVFARLMSYLFYEGRPLTTKGRWINFFIFLNFQIFSRIPAPRKIIKPIFILGIGRSGSTILGKILSIHHQVGFLNEPKAFWYFLNPQDDIIGSYNKKGSGRYFFDKNDASPSVVKQAHNIYGWYLFFTKNRRIVDKYPEHIFRIDYLRAIFPDAKFILLVRDVRSNSESIANWSAQKTVIQGEETHDWWGRNDQKWKLLVNQVAAKNKVLKQRLNKLLNTDNHKFRGEVEWFLTMEEVLKQKPKKDVFLIYYEKLVDEIDNQLTALLDNCQLNQSLKIHEYASRAFYKNNLNKASLSSCIQNELEVLLEKLGYS